MIESLKETSFLKWVTAFFSALMLSVTIIPTSVALAENNTYEPSEEEINEVASQLEFLYEEAAALDEQGNVVDFNFQLIEEEYGSKSLEGLEDIQAVMQDNNNNGISTRASFGSCMQDALLGTFGVSASVGAFEAVSTYISTASYKQAAITLLKAVGFKVSVPVLTGWLAWNAGTCL